jgi:hypothetical protein
MTCKKHPKYRAVYRPRTSCFVCRVVWCLRSFRALLGLPVAVAKTRAVKNEQADAASARVQLGE